LTKYHKSVYNRKHIELVGVGCKNDDLKRTVVDVWEKV
jgi:hypothetical protein